MFPTPIANASKRVQVLYRVALPIALVVWLLPLIAIFFTSVRSLADINQGNYWGWPTEWQLWENYSAIFEGSPMARYLINSFVVTIPAVIGSIAISTLAGFAFAVYRFRGNILLFAMFVAGNFIPFQILMIPVRDLAVELGIYDSYSALISFHIAFQAGFCTLFMRNFIAALPVELIEAARVDGASELRVFWNVVLPLVRPALAALAVLIFTFVWNDYFWALVMVQGDHARPITVGLSALKGQWLASWQLISAGSIIAALPPVALFFAMQRHFIAGLTLGATKG
ncbi:MAG: carbohydrate ABC transporter permease [Proteobacteria bacterium]|nr:carbohydrate ABC transporter permease [Pseudomonadota bacterium]